jgi:hypothetical protein
MRRLDFYILIFFFSLLYTKGLWVRLGVPDLALEGALFVLPLAIVLHGRESLARPAPGFLFVWFYLGWSLVACIYNGEGVMRGLLYARFLVTAYLVFWAIWRSSFTPRELWHVNNVILALFFLQVAAALFQWLALGEKTEAIVGTMEYKNGSIATSFPMLAFSCLLAFFLYYNRVIYLLAGLSFFVVGHASGKLAIYYFMPLMLGLGLALYAQAEGLASALRRTVVTAVVALSVSPLLLFLLSGTHRAETLQNEVGVHDKLESFLDLSQRFALQEPSWFTTTRVGTSIRVIEETFRRSPSTFLFGRGTYVFLYMSGQPDQGAYDEYGIIYGIVGWSRDAVAVGWPAMFAHVGFYIYLFHQLLKSRRTRHLGTYWKAIFLTVQLGFLVFLIVYFQYSPDFTVGGWLCSVYLYFLAVLLAPRYQESLGAHPALESVEATGYLPSGGPRRSVRAIPKATGTPVWK